MSFTLTLSKTPQTLLDYVPNDEVLYLLLKDERCAAALKTTRDVRQEKLAQPWRSSDSIPSAVTAWMKQLQRFEEPRSRDYRHRPPHEYSTNELEVRVDFISELFMQRSDEWSEFWCQQYFADMLAWKEKEQSGYVSLSYSKLLSTLCRCNIFFV